MYKNLRKIRRQRQLETFKPSIPSTREVELIRKAYQLQGRHPSVRVACCTLLFDFIRLKNMKWDEIYISEKLHFKSARDVAKFLSSEIRYSL